MLTVKELIKELSKLPKNSIVILQKDAEGNGYSPCVGAESGFYHADSTYSGEFYNQESLDDYYPEEDDKPEDLQKAVVLWPVN